MPGSTKKYLWKDLHPTRDLPQLLNPGGGYLQNANNPPWFVSLRQPLDPSRCPAYFERGELALRPQLALEMLEARDTFSVEDVKRFKFETRLLLAERVKPALLAAIAAQAEPADELAQARAVLGAWDDRASATSRGAVLFQRFWETYRAEVRQPFAEPWDAARPAQTPRGIANPNVALTHLADAVTWTRATYGAADVAWGDAHRYRLGELDLPGEGATGQLGAFRVLQFDAVPGKQDGVRVAGWAESDRQLAGFGDAWVLLVHFTRPIEAFSLLAYGQTTDRASPHSRDQIRIFAGRDLRPAWFTDADITAHLERAYRPANSRPSRNRSAIQTGASAHESHPAAPGNEPRSRQPAGPDLTGLLDADLVDSVHGVRRKRAGPGGRARSACWHTRTMSPASYRVRPVRPTEHE